MELILYLIIFLLNPHLGYLISMVVGGVTTAILVISYLVELIEPSKVPSWYYSTLGSTVVASLLVVIFFLILQIGF